MQDLKIIVDPESEKLKWQLLTVFVMFSVAIIFQLSEIPPWYFSPIFCIAIIVGRRWFLKRKEKLEKAPQ